jgi:tRNA (guanine37-N1)-methyltransferase
MRFDIITIFPNLFDSFLQESLIAKGLEEGVIDIATHDLRKWTTDKHQKVDDSPYGGGPGMVMKVEPVYKTLLAISKRSKEKGKKILLSPTGGQFDQKKAKGYSKLDQLIIIAGRYEGYDARVENFVDEKVSVGPYILSGGEIPAMVIIEAVSRLIPGFLGNPDSINKLSFDNPPTGEAVGQLSDVSSEYPVYTKPEKFTTGDGQDLSVPEVLLSGDHKKIEEWRRKNSSAIFSK